MVGTARRNLPLLLRLVALVISLSKSLLLADPPAVLVISPPKSLLLVALPVALVTSPPKSLLLAVLPAALAISSKSRSALQENILGRISERATIVTLSEMRPITTRRIT